MEAGGQMTNRQLRQTLRPERTQPMNATVLYNDQRDRRVLVVEMDEDQWTTFQRAAGRTIDPIYFPYDGSERSISRVQPIRDIFPFIGE